MTSFLVYMYLTWDGIKTMGRYIYRGKSARGENYELKCKRFMCTCEG